MWTCVGVMKMETKIHQVKWIFQNYLMFVQAEATLTTAAMFAWLKIQTVRANVLRSFKKNYLHYAFLPHCRVNTLRQRSARGRRSVWCIINIEGGNCRVLLYSLSTFQVSWKLNVCGALPEIAWTVTGRKRQKICTITITHSKSHSDVHTHSKSKFRGTRGQSHRERLKSGRHDFIKFHTKAALQFHAPKDDCKLGCLLSDFRTHES